MTIRDDTPMPTSVYRIFDSANRLIYVGVAQDVEHRVYMHGQNWANPMRAELVGGYHRLEAIEYATRAEARAAERAAIRDEAPWFNRHHNPKRWQRIDGQWFPVDPDAMAVVTQEARQPSNAT